MNVIFLSIWYIFFTSCAIASLVIRILRSFKVAIKEIQLYILVISIIYGVYMIILVFTKKNDDKSNGVKISNEESNFIRDHLFKYLFTLTIGVIFLSQLLRYFSSNFSDVFGTENTWYEKLEICCTQFIVPIIIFVDVFLIPRRRIPKTTFDLIVLLIVIFVFDVLVLFTNFTFATFEKFIASLLKSLIFTFDSYVLYDFILYHKSGRKGGYHLFDTSETVSRSSNRKQDEKDVHKEDSKLKADKVEEGTK